MLKSIHMKENERKKRQGINWVCHTLCNSKSALPKHAKKLSRAVFVETHGLCCSGLLHMLFWIRDTVADSGAL